MTTINAFIDTSTVNRILRITKAEANNLRYEEDRLYLSKIIEDYVNKGFICFIVNPSVKDEIEKTKDANEKAKLLALFNKFDFTPYNKTVFTFTFPAHFVSDEDKKMLKDICAKIPGFEKDEKIFLDALSNSEIHVLLTTDRTHLADKGLDTYGIPIFTPRQFFEYLKNRPLEGKLSLK